MSALENVAFGLRSTGTDKKVAREKASRTLARLGLDGLGEAKPARCRAASSSAWRWPAPW